MMKTTTKQLEPKERIIETAIELFYRQGYYQTGVNQIIEEADVSKATFYSHYPSKEDLAIAYIQHQHTNALNTMKSVLKEHSSPKEKLLSFIKALEQWMLDTNYRGCEFLNITSEIIDPNHPVRKEVKYHMDSVRSILTDLAEDLIKSDAKYSHLKAKDLADKYFVIMNGGIASAAEYHEIWPMKLAIEQAEELIK